MGGDVEFDTSYQGRRATISGDFTRWNELTYAQCVTANPFGGVRGTDLDVDIGALMLTEGYAYSTILVFPFAIKAAYSGQLIRGYRFPCTWIEQESLHQMGSRPRKIRLVWHALRQFTISSVTIKKSAGLSGATTTAGAQGVFNPAIIPSTSTAQFGSFLLYDSNIPTNLAIN